MQERKTVYAVCHKCNPAALAYGELFDSPADAWTWFDNHMHSELQWIGEEYDREVELDYFCVMPVIIDPELMMTDWQSYLQ